MIEVNVENIKEQILEELKNDYVLVPKEVISDITNEEYVHKDEICKLLQETEWSSEKDYRFRYLDFYNKVLGLVGPEYYKMYDMFRS